MRDSRFGVLSSNPHEAAELVAQVGSSKNRRKRERKKAQKAREAAGVQAAGEDGSGEQPSAGQASDQLDSLSLDPRVERAEEACAPAAQPPIPSVMAANDADHAALQAPSDTGARAASFEEVLRESGSLPRGVAHCIQADVSDPATREKLASLLQAAMPDVASCTKDLVEFTLALNRALSNAPGSVKELAQRSMERLVQALQAASKGQQVQSARGGAPAPADSQALDVSIKEKEAAVKKALTHNSSLEAQSKQIADAMQVVTLLNKKLELEKSGGGMVVATCLATLHEEISQLVSLVRAQSPGAGPAPGGAAAAMQELSSLQYRLSELLTHKAQLEEQLLAVQSEIDNVVKRQAAVHQQSEAAAAAATAQRVGGTGAAEDGTEAVALAFQQQATRALSGGGVGGAAMNGTLGGSDRTLQQLMENSMRCVQMQDRFMGKLQEQFGFLTTRFVNASKMDNAGMLQSVKKMLSDLRGQSTDAFKSAKALQDTVAGVNDLLLHSQAYSALRPVGMQVTQIATKVCQTHNSLVAAAQPDAILQQAEAASRPAANASASFTMEEILQRDVRRTRPAAEAAASGANVATAPPPPAGTLDAAAPQAGVAAVRGAAGGEVEGAGAAAAHVQAPYGFVPQGPGGPPSMMLLPDGYNASMPPMSVMQPLVAPSMHLPGMPMHAYSMIPVHGMPVMPVPHPVPHVPQIDVRGAGPPPNRPVAGNMGAGPGGLGGPAAGGQGVGAHPGVMEPAPAMAAVPRPLHDVGGAGLGQGPGRDARVDPHRARPVF